MPLRSHVTLTPLKLDHSDLFAAAVGAHRRCNPSIGHVGLSYSDVFAIAQEENLFEYYKIA